ncbi:MAG: arylesterase [Hydrogenophilaceae bacterium]|nr:arylesterase [Hydrogenophilaceae bacterium]
MIKELLKTARGVYAILFLALLAACDRPPQLPRLNEGDTIVAFGDSLTHGTGTSHENSYPAALSRLIRRTVINAGVPGETTSEGLERLPDILEEHQPRLVLLCLGGNDMLKHQDNGQTESNLRAMIQSIRATGANVVLIGVPEPKLFSGAPDFYEKLAEEFSLPYEGEIFNEVLKDNRLKSDPIHANSAGYRVVAERLAELLKETGALP